MLIITIITKGSRRWRNSREGDTSGVGGVRVPECSSQGASKGSSTGSSSGTTVTKIEVYQ
jgi:hypothetical protein